MAGSPLVDAVAVLADVTTDFFRNARPYGARADIGAVERGATSSVSGGRATGGVLPPLLSTGGTTSASPAQQVSPGQASLVATTATVATPTAGSTTVRPSVARRMLHGLRSLIQRDNVRAYTARLATGLRQMALLNHEKAVATRDALAAIPGVEVLTPRFFNEFAIKVPGKAAEVVETLAAHGVIAGVPFSRLNAKAGLDDVLLVAATETTLDIDITVFAKALTKVFAQ